MPEREYVIQGNGGGKEGWEDESFYPQTRAGLKEAKADIQQYRFAERQVSHRLVKKTNGRTTRVLDL